MIQVPFLGVGEAIRAGRFTNKELLWEGVNDGDLGRS